MLKFGLTISEMKHMCINSDSIVAKLCNKYKEVFMNGLGTFTKGKIQIKIKENTVPKFFKPRTLPFALKDKV